MPSGTDGGRKQPTRRPPSRQAAWAASATRGDGIGTESTAPAGRSVTPSARPSSAIRRCTTDGSHGCSRSTRRAASAPAAGDGARPVSKMNGRAVLTRCSTRAGEPRTAPPWAPRAFERVAVTTTRRVAGEADLGDQAVADLAAQAEAVGLVDDEQRTGGRAGLGELDQRRGVTEHGVDRLGQHQHPPVAGAGEGGPDRGHVVVRRHHDLGPRQPGGVDQRGVDVGVGDDQGGPVDERGDHREVGVVAGRGDQRRRPAQEGGQLALEVVVQGEGPGHQAGGAGAGAPEGRRLGRGGADLRVPREAEVVVAGQVEHGLVGAVRDQPPDQPGGLARGRPLGEPVVPACRSCRSPPRAAPYRWSRGRRRR